MIDLATAAVIVWTVFTGVATAYYYWKRLGIEETRSVSLEEQKGTLQRYYDQRLSVEKAKLDVETKKLDLRKRNGQ